jgi:hypothetical protein
LLGQKVYPVFAVEKLNSVRFEVFTAVTMKNGVFWAVTTQKTPFFKLNSI